MRVLSLADVEAVSGGIDWKAMLKKLGIEVSFATAATIIADFGMKVYEAARALSVESPPPPADEPSPFVGMP